MTTYKQTELGLIPSDWEVVELEQVANIDPENLASNTALDYEFNYISLEQVTLGKLEKTEKYKFQDAPSRARRILRKNDILVSTVRPNLMSHYWVKNEISDLICSTGFSVVRTHDEKLVASYFYHHLFANIINNQINLLVVGSNYPAINSKDVKRLKFSLPSKPEQTAIATALSDTDALLVELEKLLAKKQAIKTATMQQLLTGKTRLPEFAHYADGTPKGSLKTEWGDIPEDWEVKIIKNCCETFSGGTPSTAIQEYYGGNIKWITSSDLNKGYIWNVEKTITEKGLNNSSAKKVSKNTLLLALYGATAGVVGITKIDATINQAVLAIIPKYDNYLFLYYWFILHKNIIVENYTQGGQANLSGDIIRNIFLPMPPEPEQTAIAQILSDMDSEINALQARIEKVREIKQGMMQNLLTGKIRLPF